MTILDMEIISWRSVREGVPDHHNTVLIHMRIPKNVCISPVWLGYYDGEWFTVDHAIVDRAEGDVPFDVTAWAPVPKGPER